jgi:hypothetical protein
MTINRYRYFTTGRSPGDHLLDFIDGMVELNHASSTIKLYLSCINDVAKAMAAAGMAACDQAWRHEENLWLWPYRRKRCEHLAETADLLKLETIISLDSDEVKTDVTSALDSNPVNLVSHIPAGLSIRCERKRRAKSNDG